MASGIYMVYYTCMLIAINIVSTVYICTIVVKLPSFIAFLVQNCVIFANFVVK